MLKERPLFNVGGNYNNRTILNGNTTGLKDFNRIKYVNYDKLYDAMMNNHWRANEINMVQDSQDYKSLDPDIKRAFNKTFSFLIFLDSIQADNLFHINSVVYLEEIQQCLYLQAAQEVEHNKAYAYTLASVASPLEINKIMDEWRTDPVLLKRIQLITKGYDTFKSHKTKETFAKVLLSNYLLEGIYFYTGFTFVYSLSRMGLMPGTVNNVKLINRDENTHLSLFQMLFNDFVKENKGTFMKSLVNEMHLLIKEAVEMEIEWGKHVYGNKIKGMSDKAMEDYIKYLANKRSEKIGFPPIYPEATKNPMVWVDKFANTDGKAGKMVTDIFEKENTDYTKGLKR